MLGWISGLPNLRIRKICNFLFFFFNNFFLGVLAVAPLLGKKQKNKRKSKSFGRMSQLFYECVCAVQILGCAVLCLYI